MKTKLYNLDGNIVGEIELPAKVFGVAIKPEVVHEVMIAVRGNARRAIAHTKNRGEVSGGGKKPWKQKGTGRARHGSIRSPLWIGGGVTFGPRSNRNFSRKINRKVRRQALAMILTDKVANGNLIVLEKLELAEPKTKLLAKILSKFKLGKRTLIVLPKSNPGLFRASYNLPKAKIVTANAISFLEVLGYNTVLMPKDTLPAIEKLYAK